MVDWIYDDRLEDDPMYRNEIGWIVKLGVDDRHEVIDWCIDMMKGHWEVKTYDQPNMSIHQTSNKKVFQFFKFDDDDDFMVFKLAWCGK